MMENEVIDAFKRILEREQQVLNPKAALTAEKTRRDEKFLRSHLRRTSAKTDVYVLEQEQTAQPIVIFKNENRIFFIWIN